MRVISCALTTDAVLAASKTVTRRWGRQHARAGMMLRIVDRLRRRATDPPQRTLAVVEVVSVLRLWASRERGGQVVVGAHALAKMSTDPRCWSADPFWVATWSEEAAREGLPNMSREEFVDLLVSVAPKEPKMLTRIEWRYLLTTHPTRGLCLAGTGVFACSPAHRVAAGEPIEEVAADYHTSVRAVQACIEVAE